jgi:hypothetical protein
VAKDHRCVVKDCPREGRNQIGLRCRVAHDGATPFPNKRRTDAIFSIESDAYLCDTHALRGGTFLLMFEPSNTYEATIEVLSEIPVDVRSKHITQPEEVLSP